MRPVVVREIFGLDLHQWLNTIPLHPAGGTWLVDVYQLFQGFIEGTVRLRLAPKYLAVMTIVFV